ncbi:MAG: 3-isopropylmalate/(R)-2-methylmalate dehydratase large subunit [Candidatus Azotimanducaceae bacterium]|jgi:3-isopropylmalate/(R)-2-methylmalate dehydratase large subunit|uniref:3-isopropylmalate dehydratase large subunit LeuC n=1 Tax=Octadecabacter arcticus 238 TaxID=391616 RepID=M9RH00_9RHOB|nr:aconitase/3-isopropylmalate dehydratase large subunit family protein [Octadecabacter arcticus]AGI71018.1 3-isopropylmalate dehydratase large subunit LeuC [Octadecabacter arcticus 238]
MSERGFTIVEKILSRVCKQNVYASSLVFPEAELVTMHDWYAANAGAALEAFGVERMFDPSRVLISTDHEPLAVSPGAAIRQQQVRNFAKKYNVGHFHDVGRSGLGHVFPVEAGLVRPGMFIAGYDTHVTNFGAVGAYGVAVLTEVTELLALGSVWQTVPETVRIELTGRMQKGVSIRDVAQRLLFTLDPELVDDAVIEFGGAGTAGLGIDARYTLCNTPTEIGARSSIVEPDKIVTDYLAERCSEPVDLLKADTDARYRAVVTVDLSTCEPQVSLPPRPENVADVSTVAGREIDHAYIGSCASGMLTDLRVAAELLRGRQVNPRVRLFVTPVSQEVARAAAQEGLMEVFIKAGAIITQAGCGVCAGGRIGPVAPGEVSIGTGTRNDPGRLGAHDATLYLASPATVAASAITGKITDARFLSGLVR